MGWIKRMLFLEVEEKGKLYFLLNAFNGAVNKLADAITRNGGGGTDPQLRVAIDNLTKKVEEIRMGLREDFDALTSKFDGLESAVTAVADDIAALKTEIKEANDRANIDLSPLMARADSIEAGLRAAVGAGPGTDPDAPPVEPPVEPPV